MDYKRNQVEEAISSIFGPGLQERGSGLKTGIKRLLEADRALGRDLRSQDPESANFAFYSSDASGSGVEVWFEEYEAFALALALQLMAHGWPHIFAVSVLRRVRPELQTQHARVLRLDQTALFDQDAIRRLAKEGDFAVDNRDPVFLTIVSRSGVTPAAQIQPHACAVCRGHQAAISFAGKSGKGRPWTMVDITSVAHALRQRLARTEPRNRGRA
jgi:hypothetical protein